MNRKPLFTFLVLLALFLSSACSVLSQGPGQTSPNQAATQDAIIKQAVQATATTMAMETEIAKLQTQVAGVATGEPENPTPPPTETTIPTNTPPPTETPTQLPPTATFTPVPTATPFIVIPTLLPTATPLPCNSAKFVSDVTIPDGSTLTPGASFTKIWRLRNTGTCTWTNTYDVVFTGGNTLSAPTVLDMPGIVLPGEEIDISVNMKAPSSSGHYRSEWKLRDPNGLIFGLGRTNASFYVDINVADTTVSFSGNFIASMCTAEWTSGAGSLPCPGTNNDSRGFAFRVDNPTLESGYVDDEPALLTSPQMVTDGVIRGKFPAMRVEYGHHFRTIIGCTYESSGCDVNIQLDYQIGSGSIQTMGTWHEVYDKSFNSIDLDVSSLAGNDVRFILTVFSNGSYNNDRVLWLAPRISK